MHIESHGHGHGPDVVLLHGTPQPPDDLRPFAQALGETRRVHLVHAPGYGMARESVAPATLDGLESRLASLLPNLARDGYAMVGVSGGSYRAIRGTLTGAFSPRGIIALGPAPYFTDEMLSAWSMAIDAMEVGADLLPAVVEGMFSPAYREASPDVPRAYLDGLRAMRIETVAAELRSFLEEPVGPERLAALTVPLRMRVGALDANTPVALAEGAMATAGDATLEVVPDVAHLLHHEDGPATLRYVRESLEALG